jgi:hypothetical protein
MNEPRRSDASVWMPLVLALLFTAAAVVLVLVELAEPPPQPGFRGIALSNVVHSSGSRQGLDLFKRNLGWLPYPAPLSPDAYLWGLRAGIVAMGLLQLLALVAAVRWPGDPRRWLIGPALASAALLLYPPVSTDVFSYASFGWEANLGVNPYLVPPAKLPADPFATMNDWTSITTPYGPIWTGISRLLVAIGRNDPFAVALLFKVAIGLSSLALGWLAYAGARKLTDDARKAIGALVLVAWSPILLLESAGMAHNDAPMMLLALGGLLLAVSGESNAVRAGLLLLAAAALIKPVALPLLAITAFIRLAESDHTPLRLIREWALDLIAIAALAVVTFLPYWSSGRLPGAQWDEQRRLYFDKALKVNPLWVWAVPRLAKLTAGNGAAEAIARHTPSASRVVVAIFLISGFATALAIARQKRATDGTASLLRRLTWAWLLATAGLGLIPINAHAWYAIWALPAIALTWALTTKSGAGKWIAPLLAWLLLSFLVYHAWPLSNHPSSAPNTVAEGAATKR